MGAGGPLVLGLRTRLTCVSGRRPGGCCRPSWRGTGVGCGARGSSAAHVRLGHDVGGLDRGHVVTVRRSSTATSARRTVFLRSPLCPGECVVLGGRAPASGVSGLGASTRGVFRLRATPRCVGGLRAASNCGRVRVLPLQHDAYGTEADGHEGAEQHQRKPVDQRNRHVQDDVLEAGARVVGEVLVRQRHCHEQNQRGLDHRGEQSAVADQQYRRDAAEDVEERERTGQLGSTRGVDEKPEKSQPCGDRNGTPRWYAGQGREDGSVIQRYPGSGTLGGRHPSRLAVVQPTASLT